MLATVICKTNIEKKAETSAVIWDRRQPWQQ
jgi:hypothetical protein